MIVVMPFDDCYDQWRIQRGVIWDNCPSPMVSGAPLNGAPFMQMRSFLEPIEVETVTKNTLNLKFLKFFSRIPFTVSH